MTSIRTVQEYGQRLAFTWRGFLLYDGLCSSGKGVPKTTFLCHYTPIEALVESNLRAGSSSLIHFIVYGGSLWCSCTILSDVGNIM